MTSAVAELELSPTAADQRAPSHGRGDTLALSVAMLLAMTVAQRAIGFGRGILFCRWLEPEQLGQWDVAFGFLNLAAPLAVIGLPGAFGRYVEYYRYRGQFHAFLRRTCAVCCVSGAMAVALVIAAPRWFSRLVFGTADNSQMMVWIGLCLAIVIVHNFFLSLFIAVRRYRIVTVLQFAQSLGFAVIGLSLLAIWPAATTSIVIAFAFATLVSVAGAANWLRELMDDEPADVAACEHATFWAKLVPFAVWMWVTNLLINSFELVDRYMIVHHSGMSVDEALRQVGYYHSSRLVPLLFVAVASLLGSMITPHLSHDWERGHREAVVRRLNLTMKLLFTGLMTGSLAALIVAPWMFNIAFQHKFSEGLAVLPWTLTYCVWFGAMTVAINYLWCVERPGLGCAALLTGLVSNVAVNLVLLPRYGLHGAVWATTIANVITLSLMFAFSRWQGMRIDPGTWILAGVPLALAFGVWPAVATLAATAVLICATDWLLSANEKRELRLLVAGLLQKIARGWQRWNGHALDMS